MVLRVAAAFVLLLQHAPVSHAAGLNLSIASTANHRPHSHRGIHRQHKAHRFPHKKYDLEAKRSLAPALSEGETFDEFEDEISQASEDQGHAQNTEAYENEPEEVPGNATSMYTGQWEVPAVAAPKLLRSESREDLKVGRTRTRSKNAMDAYEAEVTMPEDEPEEGYDDDGDDTDYDEDQSMDWNQGKAPSALVKKLAAKVDDLEKQQQDQKMRELQHEVDELRLEQRTLASPSTPPPSKSSPSPPSNAGSSSSPSSNSVASTSPLPKASPAPPPSSKSSPSPPSKAGSSPSPPSPPPESTESKASGNLPGWVAVILASATAGVAVVVTSKIGECIGAPKAECVPTQAEQMQAELDQARLRARALEEALEAQRAAARAEARAAAGLPPAPAPVSESSSQTASELRAEMLIRTGEADDFIGQQVTQFMGAGSPMLAKVDHVKNALNAGIEQVKGRVTDTILAESEALLAEVKGALGDESVPDWLTPAALGGVGGEKFKKALPMIGLLLAGSMAPGRIRALKLSCDGQVMMNGIVLAMVNGIAIVDWHVPCKDRAIWIWLGGVATISGTACLMAGIIRIRCSSAINFLDDQMKLIKSAETGIPLMDAFDNIRTSGTYFMKALFRYDKIVTAFSYTLSQLNFILYMSWGGYGVYLSIAHVVIDAETCPVQSILFFMNFFSFFYVLLFTYALVGVVLWLVQILASDRNGFVTTAIIGVAKGIDDSNPSKMPIALTLVRSLFLRDTSNVYKVQAEALSLDVETLAKETDELSMKLAQLKAERDEIAEKAAQTGQSEDEIIASFEAAFPNYRQRASQSP